jgi:hypothetical protein
MQQTIKVKSLPDLGKAFAQMKIKDLLMKIPPVTHYGTCIRWAAEHKPIQDACALVLSLYAEDPKETVFVVGNETIDLIQSIYKKKNPA